MKKRIALVFMVCGALSLSGCGALSGISTFRTARMLRSAIKQELKSEKEMLDRKNKEDKALKGRGKEKADAGNNSEKENNSEKDKEGTAGAGDRKQKDKEDQREGDLADDVVSSYSDLVKFYDELLDMYENEEEK